MRPQIVLFGDSITQQSFMPGGWGAALASNYCRKVDVVLRGYGGYNTKWALFLLPHLFPQGSTPPLAVTLFFGANDAALLEGTGKRQHVPLEDYKQNLRRIVQHIKDCSSKTLVVLITPPPIDREGRREYARSLYGDKASELPDRTNEVTGMYAEQCAALAEELGLPSINLWSKMQQQNGWNKKFLIDGLHLTPEGNGFVFKELVEIFDKNGFSDLPHDFPLHSEIDSDDPESSFSE
ncbi:hypothetical protein M569_03248, partial [Genlisea aurea]